jgi:NRPS condensation-like uncharacterized protein
MSRLPLTLMEQYLFAEDKPAYPCWIFIRTRLRGTIDRTALEQAWCDTVARHPLLRAVVRDGTGRRPPFWEVLDDPPPPRIEWHRAPDVSAAGPWTWMDLRRTPAVRLIVAEHGGGCEIGIDGHHAIFDGIGAFGVLHDLFVHYARHRGADVPVPEIRPAMFAGRNQFGLNWWSKLKLTPVQLLGLWFAWQMQQRPVAPLTPLELQDFAAPPQPGFPSFMHQHLPAADLARLRAVAKHHRASLNDLLLRDLQAAIGVWRLREGIGEADDWIFLAIPVNLRRTVDRFLSATNAIGIVAIDRRAKSLTNRPRLLRRATEDMNLVKRHKLGYTFLVLLGLWRRLRGGIPRYSARRACRATTVLTNLGQPFSRSPLLDASRRLAVPGAVVEDIMMVAPCRPGTCATIAVAIYGGRLVVDLHYDPRALPDRQAETFLATFIEQLYTSIAEAESRRDG